MNIKPKRPRSLAVIAAGTALVLLTYVTPMATLPGTAADLGADAVARAWLLSSMPVGLAAGLLAAGVLGDNLGRRRVYLAGLAMLAAGAFGCAAAREPVVFLAARILEGLGGAAILACGLAILADDFPEARRRGHATAVWGAGVGVGISLGVVVSAGLGTSLWRESYVGVGVLALILLWPSKSRVLESRAANRRRLDGGGLVLFATAMTLMVCALTRGRDGIDAVTSVLAAAAVLALAGFVVVERRIRDPLIETRTVAAPRVSGRRDRLTDGRRRHHRHGLVRPNTGPGGPWSRIVDGRGSGHRMVGYQRGDVGAPDPGSTVGAGARNHCGPADRGGPRSTLGLRVGRRIQPVAAGAVDGDRGRGDRTAQCAARP